MGNYLTYAAGKKAYSLIRENGLSPESVSVITGAAGGPKALILKHLDKEIFFRWMARRKSPLHLIGASISGWRFCAAASGEEAFETFHENYILQSYTMPPPPEEVTRKSFEIMDSFIPKQEGPNCLNHPFLRISLIVARSKGLVNAENKIPLGAGLALCAGANLFHRKALFFFFDRMIFHDPRTPPDFFGNNGYSRTLVPLTDENFRKALMATGSIPMVMEGIREIAGSPDSTYRDGGVIDYHPDIPYALPDDQVVLFPHYTDRVIPGWFDKKLPFRKPGQKNMENVLFLFPTQDFLNLLPGKKIPDRHDFYTMEDDERMAYWRKCVEASRVLKEDFMEAVHSNQLRDRLISAETI